MASTRDRQQRSTNQANSYASAQSALPTPPRPVTLDSNLLAQLAPASSPRPAHALLVIADAPLAARLSVHLSGLGLRIIAVSSAQAALAVAQIDAPSLVITEDQLPDGSGIDLCAALRKLTDSPRDIQIIIIAEQADTQRIVLALRHGATDYLTAIHEDDSVLIARVQSLLGRASDDQDTNRSPDGEKAITIGKITIRPWAFNVLVDGQRIDLTVTQFRLLLLLASKPGHIVRPEQIQSFLEERGSNLRETSVKSHIYFLRRKLGPAGDQIENVRRVGYRLSDSA